MRRFRRYPPWSVWIGIALCAFVAGRFWWTRGSPPIPNAAEGSSLSGSPVIGEFQLVRVERADLLVIRQQVPALGTDSLQTLEMPLQLLGIKATELANEGRDFSTEFLSAGTPSLDLDRRRLDSAGNFLAYVYVEGRLLNEELVRAGFAEADLYPGDNQTTHRNLVKAEKEAKKAGRGKWAGSVANVSR